MIVESQAKLAAASLRRVAQLVLVRPLTPPFMKTLIHAAIVVLTITGPLHAEPTPVPKASKAKTATQVRERSALPAGATGVLVAKLRADGSVQKVLISQSTGNKAVDANAVRVLSAIRFPPDTLTRTERTKREKVFPVYQTSLEELKKFRNAP